MELPGIHLLQAAVMLAEVRNYSRAAKKLGIHQPTLTKRILELEQILGFPLFKRTTQYVELTEACRQFVEEAKQSIFHAERSLQVARAAEKGSRTVLHVGKTHDIDPHILSLLNSIELPLYPNLEVCQTNSYVNELEAELLLGKLDFVIAAGEFDNRRMTQLELMRTPSYAVIQDDSPLANQQAVSLDMLGDLSWAIFERQMQPALYDVLHASASQLHVHARSVHHVATAEEAAQELYAKSCDVAFLTQASAWRISRNGLTLRPITDENLTVSTKLIAKANNSSRMVSEFARALKRKLEAPRKQQLPLPLSNSGLT